MARQTGKTMWAQWTSGGTAVVTGDQTDFSVDMTLDKIDASAGADVFHNYLAGLKDFSATLEKISLGVGGTAADVLLKEGNVGTLLWAPEGTATGKPKWGIAALITKYSTTYPFNDTVKTSVEWVPASGTSDLLYDGRSTTW